MDKNAKLIRTEVFKQLDLITDTLNNICNQWETNQMPKLQLKWLLIKVY